MKLSIHQPALHRALSVAARAVASRSTLPVLHNVLLVAGDRGLEITGCNLEISATARAECHVEEAGSFTLPARVFGDLVGQSPAERVSLELKDGAIAYGCGSFAASLKGLPADEFPIWHTTSQEGAVVNRVRTDVLRSAIQRVAFAAATEESRPILAGVLIEMGKGGLVLAGADGFRLSRVATGGNALAPATGIVPRRALLEWLALSKGVADEEIAVTVDRNRILFEGGDIRFLAALIEGQYPDVQRLIPKSHATRTVVGAEALRRALARARIFARDSANIVKLSITKSAWGWQMRLSADAADLGANVEDLVVEVEGDGMEVAFNTAYLAEALGAIGSERVALETTSASTPGALRPVGDDSFVHVIMPMHIGSKQ